MFNGDADPVMNKCIVRKIAVIAIASPDAMIASPDLIM